MKKILITEVAPDVLLNGLEEAGYLLDYHPGISGEEILQKVIDCFGLVIKSKTKVDQNLLSAAGNLRFIGRLGSGLENIDLKGAKETGVTVLNSPEGNRNAVAEHALGMLLSLANNHVRADKEVRKFQWNREANRGWELKGKTVGIIGFGNTGSQFAKVLSGLGVRILAYDKYLTNFARDSAYVAECNLGELCEASDIISLHIPLTPETLFLVDKAFIKQCKPGMYFINTSRGKCVRTVHLLEALETGIIGGACLDVLENEIPESYTDAEKLMYQKLYNFDNVVLSPHVAGWTVESRYMMGKILLEKIANWKAGST